MPAVTHIYNSRNEKHHSELMQTLRSGCSKAEPKNFAPPITNPKNFATPKFRPAVPTGAREQLWLYVLPVTTNVLVIQSLWARRMAKI